jgi:predicted membrane-bound mannosyltransferase
LPSLLLFVVLFWRLGAPTFWDPDEAHYAETTRENDSTGDWWAPYYNDVPFFDKPVLFHQLQGASMLAFGQNELGARMLPALAALILILITVWFGARMISPDVGVVAGLDARGQPRRVRPCALRHSRHAVHDVSVRRRGAARDGGSPGIGPPCSGLAMCRLPSPC